MSSFALVFLVRVGGKGLSVVPDEIIGASVMVNIPSPADVVIILVAAAVLAAAGSDAVDVFVVDTLFLV